MVLVVNREGHWETYLLGSSSDHVPRVCPVDRRHLCLRSSLDVLVAIYAGLSGNIC